jgi:hypothetical protein
LRNDAIEAAPDLLRAGFFTPTRSIITYSGDWSVVVLPLLGYLIAVLFVPDVSPRQAWISRPPDPYRHFGPDAYLARRQRLLADEYTVVFLICWI